MEIYKKLAKVKSKIGKISKDSTNPFFKSKFFDVNSLLEHVEPLLQEEKLLLIQPISEGNVYSIIYDTETTKEENAHVKSYLKLPELNDPQKVGSAITYYRRYTLQSLLGLQAEDDDGNNASGKTTPQQNNQDDKEWLNVGDKAWNKAVSKKLPITELRKHYKVSKANAEQYEKTIS